MFLLASCATPSRPAIGDHPAPAKPDPRLCLAVRTTPKLPNGASVIRPVTPAEQDALAAFLNWVSDVLDVAVENEAKAALAKHLC